MDYIFYTSGSFITFLCMLKQKADIQRLQRDLKLFSNSNIMTPRQLMNSCDGEYYDEKKIFAFVQGIIKTKQPIESRIRKIPLIISRYFIQNLYVNDEQVNKFIPATQPTKNISRFGQYFVPTFQLMDYEKYPNQQQQSCQVINNGQVQFDDALQFVGSRKTYKNLTKLDKMLMILSFFLKFMTIKKFKGLQIGQKELEFGIQTGQILLVFGEVLVDKIKNIIQIYQPLFIVKDKNKLIKTTQKQIRSKSQLLLLLTFLFTMLVCGFIIKMKKRVEQYVSQAEEKKFQHYRNLKQLKIEGFECVACWDQSRSIIFKPCRHFSFCRLCFNKLEKKTCPVCKAKILDIIEIFKA